MKNTSICLWVLFILVSGCAFEPYRPKPLLLESEMAAYQERSLTNTHLQQYLQFNLGPDDKPWDSQLWDSKALSLVALYYHPDLDVARSAMESEKGGLITARQRPNPQAGVNIGYNYDIGELPLNPWIITPSVDFLIETAGKRRKRINQAKYQVEVARLNIGETVWQVKTGLRAQLISYLLAEDEYRLLTEEVAVRTEYTDSLQTLFDFGEIAITDMELARITLNDARLRMLATEGLVAENRILLATSLGLSPEGLGQARFEYQGLYTPPSLEMLPRQLLEREVLLNNLSLRRSMMEYLVAEATLQLEVARQYPDIQIGPSLRFFNTQRRWQANQGGIELPVFHHNQGPVAEAKANRERMAAQLLRLQASLISDYERALALYKANLKEYETAQEILTINQEREKEVEEILRIGDLTYLDLLSVRLEKTLARQGVVRALARLQASLGMLENLAQKPLEAGLDSLPNPEVNPRNSLNHSVSNE